MLLPKAELQHGECPAIGLPEKGLALNDGAGHHFPLRAFQLPREILGCHLYFRHIHYVYKVLNSLWPSPSYKGENIQALLPQRRGHQRIFNLNFPFPWQPFICPKKYGATIIALATDFHHDYNVLKLLGPKL